MLQTRTRGMAETPNQWAVSRDGKLPSAYSDHPAGSTL